LQEEQAKAEQKRLRALKQQESSQRQSVQTSTYRRPLLSADYLDENENDYDTTNVGDFRRHKYAARKFVPAGNDDGKVTCHRIGRLPRYNIYSFEL
jgi:hypothetical protein